MPAFWGLDLGTTNTVLAVCADRDASPVAVTLPDLSLEPEHWLGAGEEPTPVIPSAVELHDPRGRHAWAGAAAVNRHHDQHVPVPPELARSFKRWLGRDPSAPVARARWGDVSAACAAEAFLRAILVGLRASARAPLDPLGRLAAWLGRWPRELIIPAPVDSYETYGREVRRLARRCGVRRVRSLDEPVAAALGYGVDLRRLQTILVVDFGGGTLNLAVVRLGGPDSGPERALVLATAGQEMGGETVDAWLREEVARRTGMDPEWVHRDLAWEVEWGKKQLSRRDADSVPIGRTSLTRAEFIAILQERGLYRQIADGIAEVVRAAARRAGEVGISARIAEVLLVGGSTLLPEVPECVERAAGLRPRHWRPFEAVARGCALFGTGRPVDPVFYHDYAVRLQVGGTHPPEFEYERLIPAGSRYPTPRGQEVARYYRVRPGLDRFALPICEIGRFGWPELPWEGRANSAEYWHPGSDVERNRVRCLNEAAPDLPIRPPSQDERARLRVTYHVDDERRLRVDAFDLLARKALLEDVIVATLAEGGRGGEEDM
ncbi:MAG: Hsp70 family protein [Armatimonadetes bacterium]|nr:Hsp70 family protein [Armatimonadota bacterium]